MLFLQEHDVIRLCALVDVLIGRIPALLFRGEVINIKVLFKALFTKTLPVGLYIVQELRKTPIGKLHRISIDKNLGINYL